MPVATSQPQIATVAKTTHDQLQGNIKDSKSHDLVFAIVGHAGAGATYVATKLIDELNSCGYQSLRVRPSQLIANMSEQLGILKRVSLQEANHERTVALQDAGDELRKHHGASIVAALVINFIHGKRKEPKSQEQPLAFVIDSLKHPQEVKALREVYRNSFYLISVVCEPERRQERLRQKYKEATEDIRKRLASRDEASPREEGRSEDHKQNVRDTLQEADFFVSNEEENKPTALATALSRIIQIMTGQTIIRPTRDERGMHAAWSAALRSTCLSRPVGAAILDEAGALIATGMNDVPRAGGGLYQDGEGEDFRCFAYKGDRATGYCRNDITKQQIYQDIFQALRAAQLLDSGAELDEVRKVIEQTPVRDLIEFSRAVHAEMDAILSLARAGGSSTKHATLYSTTYPCHSCARHIVASGIREVVYIEPYHKSRAFELHKDSINETTQRATSESKKVHFRLFSGVAPRRFTAIFQRYSKLKDSRGFLVPRTASNATHQDPVFASSLDDFEARIVKYVESLPKQAREIP